eukprot:gene4648-20928_t
MASVLTDKAKTAFSITGICLSLTGLILNIVGIHALIKTKPRGNKQTLLLINISTISVFLCTLFIPSWLLWALVSFPGSQKIEEFLFIFETGFYMAYTTSTIVLTIDRFLAVAVPFKHRTIISNKFVIGSVSTCWFLGLSSRIPFLILDYPKKMIHMVYFDISINFINIIFQPVTYVYILVKWRQRQTTINSSRSPSINTRRVSIHDKREAMMLKIALMISLSCLISSVCDIIYAAMGMSTPSSNTTIFSPIALLLWNLVPTTQSLFYIITKPEIRQLLLRKQRNTPEIE